MVDADLLPDDEHNRELARQVRPADWVNPEPADRYHLVVVGGGTGGLVSAAGAAGLGARVALVERHLLGGDCLNVGCVPSKAVLRSARGWSEARSAAQSYGGPRVAGEGDFAAAMERMRRLRAAVSHHDGAARFRDLGVDVFLGRGRFVASDALEVDGRRLAFRRAIIATGARAAAPPIPGLETIEYLTNETLFGLTELPPRLGIIGGGPIGCEMAQAFARFGSTVYLIEAMERILPLEEEDAATVVHGALERDGVEILGGARVTRVASGEDGAALIALQTADGSRELAVDAVLVSVGRRPNVEELGLEAAGVAFDGTGVTVDDRLRTTNKRIYAVGDVASRYKFTHSADALARIAIQNALFFGRKRTSRLVVPWCTYTSPELAHVGIYPRQAAEHRTAIDTIEVAMASVDRAVLDGAEDGFLRVHLRRGTDRIVGATAVAEHAGDLIGEISLAMTNGVGLARIAATIHPYPTQAEVIKKAGDAWRRRRLTPRARRLFDLFFRVFR